MRKRYFLICIVTGIVLMAVGCSGKNTENKENTSTEIAESLVINVEPEKAKPEKKSESKEEQAKEVPDEQTESDSEDFPKDGGLSGKTVVIDPGHQRYGNSEPEPIGPGASERKAKVTGGTSGKTTGYPEYELNLVISLKLGEMLENAGCNVIYTRTENDVDLSNSERAEIANNANADAFVRIHADGSENSSVHGAMTICQTRSNPYNAELHDASYELAENILDALVAETGCKREKVWETDTMSGINWCTVPTAIVEVGYMTNPEEEQKLVTSEYQDKIANGILKGLENTLE